MSEYERALGQPLGLMRRLAGFTNAESYGIAFARGTAVSSNAAPG